MPAQQFGNQQNLRVLRSLEVPGRTSKSFSRKSYYIRNNKDKSGQFIELLSEDQVAARYYHLFFTRVLTPANNVTAENP